MTKKQKIASAISLAAFQIISFFTGSTIAQNTKSDNQHTSTIETIYSVADTLIRLLNSVKTPLDPQMVEDTFVKFINTCMNSKLPYHDKTRNFQLTPNSINKVGDEILLEATKWDEFSGKETHLEWRFGKDFFTPLTEIFSDMDPSIIKQFKESPDKDTVRAFLKDFYRAAQGKTLQYTQNGTPYTLKFLNSYEKFGTLLVVNYLENGRENNMELGDTHFAAIANFIKSPRSPNNNQSKSKAGIPHTKSQYTLAIGQPGTGTKYTVENAPKKITPFIPPKCFLSCPAEQGRHFLFMLAEKGLTLKTLRNPREILSADDTNIGRPTQISQPRYVVDKYIMEIIRDRISQYEQEMNDCEQRRGRQLGITFNPHPTGDPKKPDATLQFTIKNPYEDPSQKESFPTQNPPESPKPAQAEPAKVK